MQKQRFKLNKNRVMAGGEPIGDWEQGQFDALVEHFRRVRDDRPVDVVSKAIVMLYDLERDEMEKRGIIEEANCGYKNTFDDSP